MAKLKALAKDTAIYGLSSIVGRFLNYLLVPLYTYTLHSCADYGIISDLYAQTALLLVVLTFGMETSFFRFANKSEEDPRTVFSTALAMVGTVAGSFLLLVWLLLRPLSASLGYAATPLYIGIMATIVAMDAVQALLFSLLRYQKRPLRFAALKLLFILLSCLLNGLAYAVVPHYWQSWPVTVAYAFIINLICTTVVMLCFWPELRQWKPSLVSRPLALRMLRYTWPLLILGIAGILTQVAGQLMLPRLMPQAEGRTALGIYGACLKVAMVMAIITQAFRYAYEPLVFAGAKDRNSPQTMAQVMKYFIIFTLLAFLAVVAWMPVLKYLVGAAYWEGLGIIPLCMVAELLMGVYFNLSFWYKLTDKTIYGTYFSLAGCAALVLTNLLLIPRCGYWACAWACVVGSGVCVVLSYAVGRRHYPVPYPLKSIAVYVLLAAFFYCTMEWAYALASSLTLRLLAGNALLLAFAGHAYWHDIRKRTA